MNNVFSVINDFVNKYDFIQQKDIEYIENLDFDIKNYNKINGKPFVSMYDHDHEHESSKIEFGIISIIIDKYDEDEEYYSIDKNILFIIDIVDFEYKETLMEEILQKCKLYKLIS
jgi:hypothetical protein